MWNVLTSAWALLLGVGLLQIGNGLQGTLLGVRGDIEGFSTLEMSFIMSGYFIGFLGGSRMAPGMIRRVGHVRVFAALAAIISAIMIIYPLFASPAVWILGRIAIGFCFSGVYVTAESWLNNASDNAHRGQALSLYMIVQMVGIVSAQGLFLLGDPSGYEAFVIASIAISIAVAPVLLSISPTPSFERTKPLSLRKLMEISPLGCVGMFLLGGVFAAQFGMAAVYGAVAGMELSQISIFVATFYVGALLMQYPVGWLSDRVDRRFLILAIAVLSAVASLLGVMFGMTFTVLLSVAFVIGGLTNPLYSLLIAHTNDYLEHDDMAAASGGLVFINGLGAVTGPLIVGWMMGEDVFGPAGYFLYFTILMAVLSAYVIYRQTQRASIPVEDAGSFSPMGPTATPVAVEFAQEVVIEEELESENAAA